jgi:drug/metabolite transporter (DMT)-like permease
VSDAEWRTRYIGRVQTAAIPAAAGAAVLIWAGTAVVTKYAVGELDPLSLGMMRTVFAAIVTGPLVLALGLRGPRRLHDCALLAVSSFGGFVAFPILFTIGLRYTSASHAALILAALPIYTGMFAAIFERKAPSAYWLAGAALALAGEVFLVAFEVGFASEGRSASEIALGDGLTTAGALAASLGYVGGARLSRTISSWSTTLWGITVAGAVLAPVLWLTAPAQMWSGFTVGASLSVLYLAIFSTILGYAAWYWALAHGGVARVGLAQFLQPVATLALGAIFLGEAIRPALVIATAVILFGVFIAQRR